MVQLNVWTGTKWVNIFDGNDFKNMNIDLHRVAKVVEDQVAEIDKAVKQANDAMDQANQAVDASNVNKTAISDVEKAANEAKQNIADALKKVTDLGTQVNKNQTDIEQTKESVALKADQTTVNDIKKTATDNSAAVSLLNNEIKLKVDSTTVNKIIDDKGYTTTETAQALIDQTANKISNTITSLKATVDKNGNLISSASDQLSNFTQTLDGLQTTVKNKADQSQITQLSDQITAKVSTKDYTTEIAALEKDLNLRISKGDVISQLNLEAGGNGLIQVANGKGKLLLDADSVVFSNKAFIPSAAITSLSADKITSGTLDAGNVQIINLTADHIKGGTLDVGNMNIQNFSANDIEAGTLSGVTIRAGDTTDFFQTSQDNIYWIASNGEQSALIGKGRYVDFPGFNIFDSHAIYLGTWAGAYLENGTIKDTGGSLGHPKFNIETSADSAFDLFSEFGEMGAPLDKSRISGWVGQNEFFSLKQTQGFYVELNPDTNTSQFRIQKNNHFGAYFGEGDVGNQINLVAGDVNVTGNFHVTGAKNSIVNTKQGYLAINAYETAEYYFGDIGEDNTGNAGQVVIGIDRIFNETVNTDIQYQVFVTPYSDAHVWVKERYNNRFVVCSDKPNAEFGWELKAKRKGYESNRLRRVSVDVNPLQLKGETK